MKRTFFAASAALVVVAFALWKQPFASAGNAGPGDANCDGQINSIDASVILQYAAGLTSMLACDDKANVNGDSDIDSVDAALILQFTAGLLDHLGPVFTSTPTRTRTPTLTPISTPTPTDTSTPTETPEPVTWLIDPGVSPEDEEYIRSGIEMAGVFLDKHLGGRKQDPITVQITTQDLCGGFPATGGPNHLCFAVAHPQWTVQPAFGRPKIAAHEYFHAFQSQSNYCVPKPVWLLEGSAEFFAFEVIIENNLVDRASVDSSLIDSVVYSTPPLSPLEDYEDSYGSFEGAIYPLWRMAVQQLTASVGFGSFRSFCEAAGPDQGWHEAFTTAFGVSPLDFYAAFEEFRQHLEPSSASHVPP